MKTRITLASMVVASSAIAADYRPIQGDYAIGGKTLIDPPPSEPQDTHLYLDLAGSAARDLYNALKAAPAAGVCGEPGDLTKRQGGVQCTMLKGGREYHCAFGIELKTQKVVGGVVC